MITVSVPGKVHLMGEHAVVYGKPALLAAVNLRLTVAIAPNDTGFQIVASESDEYARYAVEFLTKTYKLPAVPSVTITITSDIPAGFHLGSSAAVAVGVVGAFTYFIKKTWNPMAINQLAYEIEKKQHGNPSGGDNTAVTMGGFVWFRKELEFLKSIWQLPFQGKTSLNHFFLINTGRPVESTGDMVAWVKTQKDKDPAKFESILNENEQQTKRVATAIKHQDEKELIDAMICGEKTLENMGVVSDSVIPFIRSIEHEGGAAKILGGGGKKNGVGFVLCYHEEKSIVDKLSTPHAYTVQSVLLGEEGVRLESKT